MEKIISLLFNCKTYRDRAVDVGIQVGEDFNEDTHSLDLTSLRNLFDTLARDQTCVRCEGVLIPLYRWAFIGTKQ